MQRQAKIAQLANETLTRLHAHLDAAKLQHGTTHESVTMNELAALAKKALATNEVCLVPIR